MNSLNHLVIQTQGLSKTFKGVQALKSLSMTVSQNSIFGFLGPNGAGKTTTIKLLLGLARPTSGSVTIFGEDIIQNSVAIRKRVGYLAQGQPLPTVTPIIGTMALTMVFIAIAIWRFGREEF